MGGTYDSLPNKKISSVVSLWWKDRVEELIELKRPEDAKSLYLEFGDYRPRPKNSNK